MEMALHCRNHWDIVEGLRSCCRCGQTYCRDCLVDINGLGYCATCKNETLLDVRSGVVIGPTALNLASPLRRLAAVLLDGLILGVPYGVIIGIAVFSQFSGGQVRPETMVLIQLLNLSLIVVYFVYEGFMLAARGQTVGKIAVGIKVVRADGSDISKGQAWGRAAMRQVLVSCLCLINYLPILFTQEKTALHDMVANTRVVNWS